MGLGALEKAARSRRRRLQEGWLCGVLWNAAAAAESSEPTRTSYLYPLVRLQARAGVVAGAPLRWGAHWPERVRAVAVRRLQLAASPPLSTLSLSSRRDRGL